MSIKEISVISPRKNSGSTRAVSTARLAFLSKEMQKDTFPADQPGSPPIGAGRPAGLCREQFLAFLSVVISIPYYFLFIRIKSIFPHPFACYIYNFNVQ